MKLNHYLFFDSASTSRCSDRAAELVKRYAIEDYGNPSSSHALGQTASQAIKASRQYFGKLFQVDPPQVIFTGSGSEADNLAIYGVALDALAKRKNADFRIITCATEHAAARKTVQSLSDFGIDVQFVGVNSKGQVTWDLLEPLITPKTLLISVHQVNNIVGTIQPIEELAAKAKAKLPTVLFHTDAVQGFGKVQNPKAPSCIDLVSISAHKIRGPKGVGALIILNKSLLKSGLRPLVWGGDQEGGFRSGTQNAGLIAGFHIAAEETLREMDQNQRAVLQLNELFHEELTRASLLPNPLQWNSPSAVLGEAVPQIVSLSIPGFPASSLVQLLQEKAFLISTGSACSSGKSDPDPVLSAMSLPKSTVLSAMRVSLSSDLKKEDIQALARALRESIDHMTRLLVG